MSTLQVWFTRPFGYVAQNAGTTMLEELSAIALLGIIVCQYYLIRGCTSLNGTIGQNGGVIHDQTARISDLLDELIQVVVDVVPPPSQSGPVAQPVGGIPDLLAMFLNNRMNMPQTDTHGDKKESEWEILKANGNPTPTNE